MLPRAVCAVALLMFAVPARADDAATAWKHQNPFCNVLAQVDPAGDRTTYAVALFSGAGTAIDAHVTLIGATDAYDAFVTAAPFTGPPGDRRTAGVLVKVPDDARIAWFYVDSYAVDGRKTETCPSYIFSIGDQQISAPANTRTIEARHLQALPPLKCGRPYIGATLRGDLQSPVGIFGNRPLTVVGRSYIDSNGFSVREEIVQSSGVAGLDSYLLGAMHVHQFSPAQFLCTPVVSTVEVQLKYFP